MTTGAAQAEVRSDGGSLALLALRLGLGGLFLIAAYLKLFAGPWSAQSFSEAVQAFRVTDNDTLVTLATFCIPWVELVCGAALVLGLWTRAAGLALALLLAVFISLIVSAIGRELSVKCQCFGNYRLVCTGTVNWCKVGENSVLMLGAMALQTWGGGRVSVDGLLGPGSGKAGNGA